MSKERSWTKRITITLKKNEPLEGYQVKFYDEETDPISHRDMKIIERALKVGYRAFVRERRVKSRAKSKQQDSDDKE